MLDDIVYQHQWLHCLDALRTSTSGDQHGELVGHRRKSPKPNKSLLFHIKLASHRHFSLSWKTKYFGVFLLLRCTAISRQNSLFAVLSSSLPALPPPQSPPPPLPSRTRQAQQLMGSADHRCKSVNLVARLRWWVFRKFVWERGVCITSKWYAVLLLSASKDSQLQGVTLE